MKIFKYSLILFHLFNIFQALRDLINNYSNFHFITIGFHILTIIISIIIIVSILIDKITLIYLFIIIMVIRTLFYPFGWIGQPNLIINVIGHIIGLIFYFLINYLYIILYKKYKNKSIIE